MGAFSSSLLDRIAGGIDPNKPYLEGSQAALAQQEAAASRQITPADLALKQAQAQAQQANTQNLQLEAQTKQLQLKDAAAIGALMQRTGGALPTDLGTMVQYGVSPQGAQSWLAAQATYNKTNADTASLRSTTEKNQQDIEDKEVDRIVGNALSVGAHSNWDDQTTKFGIQNGLADASRQVNSQTDPAMRAASMRVMARVQQQLGQQPQDPAQRVQYLQGMYDQTAAGGKDADLKTKAAAGAKDTAQAKEAESGSAAKDVETQLNQYMLNLIQQGAANPQAGSDAIDSILPKDKFPTLNGIYHTRYANAGQGMSKPEDIAKARAALLKEAGDAASEVAPEHMAAKAKQAQMDAQATAGVETSKAIATAKALRQGDNPAVAGVAPAAVAQVQNQAMKFDEDYIKANSVIESMGKILDLAESGNKAAGSNLPLVGVETLNAINGIKRINRGEIDQYQGAGDLLDVIKGKLGKLTEGKPIPQDVLNDVRELHQTLGQQAYNTYTRSLDNLNQRTGSKYTPTQQPPNIRKGGGSPNLIYARDPQGNLHSAPAGSALPAGWKPDKGPGQ